MRNTFFCKERSETIIRLGNSYRDFIAWVQSPVKVVRLNLALRLGNNRIAQHSYYKTQKLETSKLRNIN